MEKINHNPLLNPSASLRNGFLYIFLGGSPEFIETCSILNCQLQLSLTPLGEVLILDHADGVLVPAMDHGPYLCVGVASDVILQDSVDIITSFITTCK